MLILPPSISGILPDLKRWFLSIEGVYWRCVLDVFIGGVYWMSVLEVCIGCMYWMYVLEVCIGCMY